MFPRFSVFLFNLFFPFCFHNLSCFRLLSMSSHRNNMFSDTVMPASMKIELQVDFIPLLNNNVAISAATNGAITLVPSSKQHDGRTCSNSIFCCLQSQIEILCYANIQKVVVSQLVVQDFDGLVVISLRRYVTVIGTQ